MICSRHTGSSLDLKAKSVNSLCEGAHRRERDACNASGDLINSSSSFRARAPCLSSLPSASCVLLYACLPACFTSILTRNTDGPHLNRLLTMVATRNHPRDFEGSPTPESATKRATRAAVSTLSSSLPDLSSVRAGSPTQTTSKTRSSAPTRHKGSGWSHTPSQLTLIWLTISLPLVIWDTGYVLLRPYSMPGGFLHKPIWSAYELYGTVDHVYGFPALEEKNGWTAAQGSINAVETVVYLCYLYIVFAHGQLETTQGRGAPDKQKLGRLAILGESRTVYGKEAVIAVLLAYTTAWITLSKTILYCEFSRRQWHPSIQTCLTLTRRAHGSIFRISFNWAQQLVTIDVLVDHSKVFHLSHHNREPLLIGVTVVFGLSFQHT